MHARVTRYEGGAPEAIDEALEAKKKVLPTEFGQTEGMMGAIFLADRGPGVEPYPRFGFQFVCATELLAERFQIVEEPQTRLRAAARRVLLGDRVAEARQQPRERHEPRKRHEHEPASRPGAPRRNPFARLRRA